jgi:hypothetical protein
MTKPVSIFSTARQRGQGPRILARPLCPEPVSPAKTAPNTLRGRICSTCGA